VSLKVQYLPRLSLEICWIDMLDDLALGNLSLDYIHNREASKLKQLDGDGHPIYEADCSPSTKSHALKS